MAILCALRGKLLSGASRRSQTGVANFTGARLRGRLRSGTSLPRLLATKRGFAIEHQAVPRLNLPKRRQRQWQELTAVAAKALCEIRSPLRFKRAAPPQGGRLGGTISFCSHLQEGWASPAHGEHRQLRAPLRALSLRHLACRTLVSGRSVASKERRPADQVRD